MVQLHSCWSPCLWHNNVHEGSMACATYSLLMSICLMTYTVYAMTGGDTSQLWLPFFETNLDGSMGAWGGLALGYLIFLAFSSVLLIFGVR